ncbi:hypothetical protein [Synechococcus sp. BO 8801]|uniref:hypothetical protein n=1 Tax=Synechococcus sp. BO 8801 TaxID=169670 RepID=UPI00117E286C|nr:hypothetical protein [Synechococcus sp. BO 8801]
MPPLIPGDVRIQAHRIEADGGEDSGFKTDYPQTIQEKPMWMFAPTANLKDFERVPGLTEAWSDFISDQYETNLYGKPSDRVESALEELQRWGRSDSDLRVYNPASMPIPDPSPLRNVTWSALPTSFDEQFNTVRERLTFLDTPQLFNASLRTRIQDEYCEWVVQRNPSGAITEVLFTSEPPEYYDFLFVKSQASRDLLVTLYREITGVASITLSDLVDARGDYDWYNRYNNEYAVHMQQPNNTLSAQINIVSRSCLLRINSLGTPIVDALGLIRCGRYGDPARQSDPRIGSAINTFTRENRFITLENPVGLYMSGVDWNGWETPDGTPAQTFWSVLRGTQNADPNLSYIARARFAVPPEMGYTVSDLKIGGEPIEFGAQIAARLNIRVGVYVSDPANVPPPRAIGCTGTTPFPLASGGLSMAMSSGGGGTRTGGGQ